MIHVVLITYATVVFCGLFAYFAGESNFYWSAFFGGKYLLCLVLILAEAIENACRGYK
jgi:hypothetical protein